MRRLYDLSIHRRDCTMGEKPPKNAKKPKKNVKFVPPVDKPATK